MSQMYKHPKHTNRIHQTDKTRFKRQIRGYRGVIQNNTDDSVPQYHQQTSKLFHSKLSTPKDSTQEAHEGFCIERAKIIQSHGIKRENDLMVLLFFFLLKVDLTSRTKTPAL